MPKLKCFCCNKYLKPLKPRAALRLYIDTAIFIPPNARCCASHLDDNGFLLKSAMNSIKITSDFTITDADMVSE